MQLSLKGYALTAALLCVALPITAHHGPGSYDRQRDVVLEGVVTRFLWASPHVYIDVQTSNETNDSITWSIEGSSPQVLSRLGWSQGSLVAGDRVTVIAFPARNPDAQAAAAKSVLKADGTLLNLPTAPGEFAPGLRTPFVAADLSGHWLPRYDAALASEVVSRFVRPRAFLPLTEKGLAAVDSFDPNLDMPAKNCIGEAVPRIVMFPDMLDIELGENVVLIRQEDQIDRTVHMKLDSHDGAERSHQGHSIGSWEDDVLVVDTTHFTDHRVGNARGLPSGSQKHLVERFALTPDRTGLEYTFRLEDPEYLTEAVTATVVLTHRPDLSFVSLPCDPESAGRYLEDAPL